MKRKPGVSEVKAAFDVLKKAFDEDQITDVQFLQALEKYNAIQGKDKNTQKPSIMGKTINKAFVKLDAEKKEANSPTGVIVNYLKRVVGWAKQQTVNKK